MVRRMNLWKRFWSNPYKWGLWHWIGGRPLTYQLRDLWYRAEFVWIIGLIAVGVWMGHNLDWLEVLKWMAVFTIGYIAGHLFWGKKYQENQQGD